MTAITKHFNHDYSGAAPTSVGDRYYGQDQGLDFNYLRQLPGQIMKDIGYGANSKAIMYGLIVSQTGAPSSPLNTLEITSGVAYAPFSVTTPLAWAMPPTTQSQDVEMIRINVPVGVSGLAPIGLVINTTFYVKLKYSETNGDTRQRAHASGSYAAWRESGYTIYCDTVAPTAYEVKLATFQTANVASGTLWNFSASSRDVSQIQMIKDAIDPLGVPKPFMGVVAPSNHVLADSKTLGSSATAATYAGDVYYALYAALWVTAGVNNGTGHWMTNGAAKGGSSMIDWVANRTITLDYRGAVLRAVGAGAGWIDTTDFNSTVNIKQNDQGQSHFHTTSGNTGIESATHEHTYNSPTASAYAGPGSNIVDSGIAGSSTGPENATHTHPLTLDSTVPITDGTHGTPREGYETRMKNIGVNIIFRYQ